MNTKLDKILAEISAGELIDKITILEIKKAKIANKDKLIEIEKELSSLNETMKKCIPDHSKVLKFKDSNSFSISSNFNLFVIFIFFISKIVILSINSPAEISANILSNLVFILIFLTILG